MRPFALLLPAVLFLSLACSAGSADKARDKACGAACEQGRERCAAECPDGIGQKACKAACEKVKGQCVSRCSE
ncbi:MAG: hypothetical protein KC621_13060 [Myxococcales bacterium]|nr:hypothetical protein [Myxococcales bacterium]